MSKVGDVRIRMTCLTVLLSSPQVARRICIGNWEIGFCHLPLTSVLVKLVGQAVNLAPLVVNTPPSLTSFCQPGVSLVLGYLIEGWSFYPLSGTMNLVLAPHWKHFDQIPLVSEFFDRGLVVSTAGRHNGSYFRISQKTIRLDVIRIGIFDFGLVVWCSIVRWSEPRNLAQIVHWLNKDRFLTIPK